MNINYFKKKLEEEKEQLEKNLSKIAQRNPQNPEDWETKSRDLNIMASEASEIADSMEEFGNLAAVETEMEQRLNEVKNALKRIEEDKYGLCAADKQPIEENRLHADPAASTCIKHAD